MKVLNSFGPNPRMLRMFLIEKGIDLPMDNIDIIGGENREADYLARNPYGAMPTLILDDGTAIGETIPICEYLEEIYPQPSLFGSDARARVNTRMWLRRTELNIGEHMYHAFRYSDGYGLFENRVYCIPEAANGLKAKAQDGLRYLDGLLGERAYIAGDEFSIADLPLYTVLDFMKDAGQPLERENHNIAAWFDRIDGRDSATRSLHPECDKLGWRG